MLADDLSELERDALTELVNIAVSGAASRLRAMVGSEVGLTVPIVEVLGAAAAAGSLAALRREQLIVVRQAFTGRLEGQAMLLLGPGDGETLARAVIGEGHASEDYLELRDDALGEVGNVLLLGLLATISAMLGVTFEVEIPTVEALRSDQVFPADRVVLLIHVDFAVRHLGARGYFALVLGLGSFEALRDIIRAFLADLLTDEVAVPA